MRNISHEPLPAPTHGLRFRFASCSVAPGFASVSPYQPLPPLTSDVELSSRLRRQLPATLLLGNFRHDPTADPFGGLRHQSFQRAPSEGGAPGDTENDGEENLHEGPDHR